MSAGEPRLVDHMRVPYFRPRSQGGDTAQPLCMVPLVGWAGPAASAVAMTDDPDEVDCIRCLKVLEAGGLAERRQRRVARAVR